MKAKILSWGLMACLVGAVTFISSSAFSFEPFAEVQNVCPECTPRKSDALTTNDGTVVRGQVIAENSEAYIFYRFGEVRSIPKNQVQNVEWAEGSKPGGLSNPDQIILKDGHVLSGTIVDDKDKPAIFQIKLSHHDQTVVVFKSQVQTLFKGGSKASF